MGRAGLEPATLGLKVPQNTPFYSPSFQRRRRVFRLMKRSQASYGDFIAPWTICLTMCPTE
jgi:hypothetical protein